MKTVSISAPTEGSHDRLIDEKALAVLGDLEYACVTEVADRTGVSTKELLNHMVRNWYETGFDVTAPRLREEIAQSKRDAAKWGSQVQA